MREKQRMKKILIADHRPEVVELLRVIRNRKSTKYLLP